MVSSDIIEIYGSKNIRILWVVKTLEFLLVKNLIVEITNLYSLK